MRSILTECMRKAIASPHERKFQHYSFIISKNKIMSMGKNIQTCEFARNIHSEVAAWRKANKKIIDEFYCINIRLKQNGTGISAPCVKCQHFLKHIGCSKCIFTTEDSWATLNF